MAAKTPEAFAAALEALVSEYGQKLNDNEVITALEGQLTRAWADACEPQPPGLFAAAPQLLGALKELSAVVRGECPGILNEDSGGDAELAMRIEDAIAKAEAA